MKELNANELLESINRELNQMDINELYKAVMAYSIGLNEIDECANEALDEAINWYFDNDNILSFINEDLYAHLNEMLD